MNLRRVPVILVVFCLAIGAASAVEIRENFQESFDIAPGAILELHHGDGDVTLTPWDQDRIEFRIVYQADITKVGFGAKPDFDVKFGRSGDRLVAKEEVIGSTTFGFYSRNTITYTWEIRAPAWAALEFHGDDGDVTITGWQADMDLRMDDGDLELADIIAGRISINLDDGDVEGRNVTAALQIVSDDGDVLLAGMAGPELVLATDDGDAAVDFAGKAPDLLKATSDDGDFRFRFPADASFAYEIRTDGGRVLLDLAGERQREIPEDGGRISGAVGGGAGQVIISTDDGNVKLTTD